eukprot:TRINITY_DN43834_c0_g1_i1.p1 TRINITY_DN43834_c0_g1~~TRINITY_DN43834_c0_g1_i1.p1  ORF type:complete len:394 (+),score=12.20 TRINITY_DN43834_c0_g1_i1:78-1259(+)
MLNEAAPVPLGMVADRSPVDLHPSADRWFVPGSPVGRTVCLADVSAARRLEWSRRVSAAVDAQLRSTREKMCAAATMHERTTRLCDELPPLREPPITASVVALRARRARAEGVIPSVSHPRRERAAQVSAAAALTGWALEKSEWYTRSVAGRPQDYKLDVEPNLRARMRATLDATRVSLATAGAVAERTLAGNPALWSAADMRGIAERVRSFLPPSLKNREEYEQRKQAALRIQTAQRARVARGVAGKKKATRDQQRREHASATRIQNGWRARGARQEVQARREVRTARRRDNGAATRIQTQWRGRKARSQVTCKRQHRAALRIQRQWRNRQARRVVNSKRRVRAARRIQLAWRRSLARREAARRRQIREQRAKADAQRTRGQQTKRRKSKAS